MTTTLEWNARAVGWLRDAVDRCNLNHVPQSVKKIIKTGAWRARYEHLRIFKFETFSDFITKPFVEGGCGWKPELVEGLLQKADDPEALKLWHEAMRADDAREVNAEDLANKREVGRPPKQTEILDDKKDV